MMHEFDCLEQVRHLIDMLQQANEPTAKLNGNGFVKCLLLYLINGVMAPMIYLRLYTIIYI